MYSYDILIVERENQQRGLDMDEADTNNLLDTITSMVITCYNLRTMSIDFDLSIPFITITKELKHRGVTLEQIEESIKNKDFTNMLTDCGSGNRERGFVMEVIEEYYYDYE